jgi:Flp pilus assembly protein TadB
LTNSKTEITGHLLDKGYTAMLRRIAALILLIGFIFVIINILFIGINTGISVFIYAIFCVYYLLVINRKNDNPQPEIPDNIENQSNQPEEKQ